MNKISLAAVLTVVLAIPAFSQTTSVEPEKEELRMNLNSSGSHYIKTTFLNQVWIRLNQSNPGTLVLGDKRARSSDDRCHSSVRKA